MYFGHEQNGKLITNVELILYILFSLMFVIIIIPLVFVDCVLSMPFAYIANVLNYL